MAVLNGDLAKAQLLRTRGANTEARGRCGAPPLSYGVTGHHPEMVRWLLAMGQPVDQLRRELHERGEPPHIGTEEVRVRDAHVLLGHEQELVGTDGPVRGAALDQAGLEVQERLVGL